MAMGDQRSSQDGATRGERLDEGLVRELASYAGPTPVTSLYLDVDGRHRPTAADVDLAVGHLYRRARRISAAMRPGVSARVEADLAAASAWLADGLDRRTTRGVALFSCAAFGLLRAVDLPVPVRDHVAVGDRPDVLPLADLLEKANRYLLVLVDRQESRFVHARLGRLEEHPGPFDPVERQVDNDVEVGSWERRHQEATTRHLRRVAAAVSHELQINPVDALVLGGSREAVDGLLAFLPAAATPEVVERTALPVRAGRLEQAQALDELDRRVRDRHEAGLVIDLRDGIGTGRGAGGLEATLDALADGRVATLVVKPGYVAVGARCPACGYLAVGARPCPRCGAGTEPVDDIVDAAVETALAQHATVELCSDPGMQEFGDVAALERY